jgi:hypothetical protein
MNYYKAKLIEKLEIILNNKGINNNIEIEDSLVSHPVNMR